MSDFILLKSENQCPKCRVRRNNITGFCHNCGVKLFSHTSFDFKTFEAEASILNWWAYDPERGWMFRDFFMIANAKPLTRMTPLDKKAFDPNYGRQTTPGEVASAFHRRDNRTRHRRK